MSRKIYDLTARCGCCRRLRLQFFLAMGGRLCYNSVRWKPHPPACAGMMELADVTDSKSVGSDTVWVQVPLPAPRRSKVRFAPTSFVPMAKRRHPPAPLLLLSKSNPLRWASIWYWVQIRKSRHLYCCDVPCSSQAAYRLRRLFHFIAKLIARSFCCFSSPNRNRLRRIAIWFWGAELKAKTSMPMRFPTSGQSLFCSGSGGRDSGLLRRADAVLAKRAGAKRMQAQRR